MSGVDDRMVSMKFDNATFQSKLNATITDLSKLRDSLALTGATKGMQDVSTASKGLTFTKQTGEVQDLNTAVGKFSVSGMVSSVGEVTAKFSAMSAVGVAALATLVSKATTAGLAFAKSLTIAPIMQGFNEFELKMGSIQTIMAGSGESLEVVNRKLAELNAYSDKTIYSFKDMTSNIGKFTNAGVSLDKSVAAIQGVANVAALSGANAEEASRGMYNFAQALSAGHVKLMDWKSIELANMATVEFKTQLMDAAVEAGTLTKSIDGYKTKSGETVTATKGFNESLQEQWLTSEALTETLGKYSDATTDIGARATAAATDVKTFSQMIDTMKESVGSGWATTFEHIFGNFEEGKKLWTGINNWFGDVVGASADARNELLHQWKFMGGRDVLIKALTDSMQALGEVISPIRKAFTDIFPPMTAQRLFEMTKAFAAFASTLKLGEDTMDKIRAAARGVFAVFEIGWTIVKELAKTFGALIGGFSGAGSGALNFAANTGDLLVKLNEMLVAGGGITRFFQKIREYIAIATTFIMDFKDSIVGLFSGFSGSEAVEQSLQRVGSRLDGVRGFAGQVSDAWAKMGERLEGVRGVLEDVWNHIATWFKELGSKLAAVMQPGDFNAAVDIVNVGLLGGIALLLKKFLNGGLNLNFGDGIMEKIGGSFDQLTGTLKTMQADLKAKALLKIAAAVGILTASVVALSMIDSAALTKAMIAMSIGFGQLLGVMALMDKASMGTGGLRMNAMAASMILMATAMGVLSMAVTNLSQLSWEELAKGLGGVGVAMAIMVTGVNLISANTGGMIRAGVAMTAIAVAIRILAEAVEAFAEMEWSEMAQGMAGVAVGLGIITAAANLLPKGMAAQGAGIVLIATGLRILAEAVSAFGAMEWSVMGQGLVGIGGGLVIIAGAMHLMPTGMVLQAGALVILSGALNVLAMAVARMGDIAFGEMAKGIGGLGAMLVILAGALHLMNGTLAGSAALVVAAGGLVILTNVLKELSQLSLSELAMGLGAMAAVFAVLGGASYLMAPLVPTLMGLGVALGIVGGAFLLFGGGAMMLGKAFEIVAKSGRAGAKAVVDIIAVFLTARIKIVQALVGAIIQFAQELLDAAPLLIKSIRVLLGHILETIIELVPQIAETISTIVTEALTLIREKVPELIETGFVIILSLLKGVRDNIGEVVTVAADIITNFLDAMSEKLPEIVDSVYNLIHTALVEVAGKLGYAVPTLFFDVSEAIIDGFMAGLRETWPKLRTWFTELPGKILTIIKDLLGIKSPSSKFFDIAIDIINGLFNGLTGTISKVTTWFTELPGKILGWVGDVTRTLWEKGTNFVSGLVGGLGSVIGTISSWFTSLPGKILGFLGDVTRKLWDKGKDFISGLYTGVTDRFEDVKTWFGNLKDKVFNAVGNMLGTLKSIGKDIMDGLWEGLKDKWEDVKGWLNKLNPARWFNDINPYKGHAVKNLVSTGGAVMQGLWNGMKDGWSDVKGWLKTIDPSESITEPSFDGINDTFNQIVDQLRDLDEFNPVITPVLDLTKVQAASRGLERMLGTSALVPEVSINRARHIATTSEIESAGDNAPTYTGPTEIKFEQNNYSPAALSTSDIYRNTRSQIALAKEELEIV